jgi:hypothetical protein
VVLRGSLHLQVLDPGGRRSSPQFNLFRELVIRAYLAVRSYLPIWMQSVACCCQLQALLVGHHRHTPSAWSPLVYAERGCSCQQTYNSLPSCLCAACPACCLPQARTVAEPIIATVSLMAGSGLPCFSRGAPVANLRNRFHLEMNDAQVCVFAGSRLAGVSLCACMQGWLARATGQRLHVDSTRGQGA